MDRNFQRSLSLVLKWEGGFVNHPKDPGGATNKGITLATFRRYVKRNGTVDDLKRITDAQVSTVYRKQYWDAVKGDDLPSGVDYAVFDFAVNSGPARAAKYLQAAVGVTQDGKIGPVTIAAARGMNAADLVAAICAKRMAFLKGLRTWPTFGKGWTNRVNDVVREATKMASGYGEGITPKPSIPRPSSPETGTEEIASKSLLARILSFIANLFRKLA